MWIKNVYLGQVLTLIAMNAENITALSKVMQCGGSITSELLGVKNNKNKQKNYLM